MIKYLARTLIVTFWVILLSAFTIVTWDVLKILIPVVLGVALFMFIAYWLLEKAGW